VDKQDRKKCKCEETQAKCQMDGARIHARSVEITEHTRCDETEAIARNRNWNAGDCQHSAFPCTRFCQIPVRNDRGKQRKQRANSAACFDEVERAVRADVCGCTSTYTRSPTDEVAPERLSGGGLLALARIYLCRLG